MKFHVCQDIVILETLIHLNKTRKNTELSIQNCVYYSGFMLMPFNFFTA